MVSGSGWIARIAGAALPSIPSVAIARKVRSAGALSRLRLGREQIVRSKDAGGPFDFPGWARFAFVQHRRYLLTLLDISPYPDILRPPSKHGLGPASDYEGQEFEFLGAPSPRKDPMQRTFSSSCLLWLAQTEAEGASACVFRRLLICPGPWPRCHLNPTRTGTTTPWVTHRQPTQNSWHASGAGFVVYRK
jgi:hypothetical protein